MKFGLILLCWFCVLALPLMAQENGLSLTTSPLPVNLVAKPGTIVTTQLKVKNNGLAEEKLEVGLMKFASYGDDGKPRLKDREVGDDYFDWVTFSEPEFDLQPGQWKTVIMTINIPESASLGYYYAVVFSRRNEIHNDSASRIVGATASLVLLEVRVDGAIRKLEVDRFLSIKKIYEFLPVRFEIKISNKGNVHLAPKGSLYIDRGKSRDEAILSVNEYGGNILPGSSRVFEVEWVDGFPVYKTEKTGNSLVMDEKGNVKEKLVWEFEKLKQFRWGKYQANLLLVYDDGVRDIPVEAVVDFWVIPYRFVLVATTLIGLFGLGVWTVIKGLFGNFIGRQK